MPFAFAGAAGGAILFIFILVGTVVVTTYVVALAARCFLVVLQQTAAGLDRVLWPDEPMYDWLRDVFYLVSLLAVWLVPAGLLARGLRKVWLPDEPNGLALRFAILALPGLWLLMPVGLVSALSSQSGWGFFRLTVLHRFARVFLSVLAFYVLSAALFVGGAVLWYLALFRERAVFLPLAAPVGAAILLVYARLLGRISWLSQRALPDEREARPEPRKRPRGRKKARGRAKVEVLDPWAAPEQEEPTADAPDPAAESPPVDCYEMSNEPPTTPPEQPLADDSPPIDMQPDGDTAAPRPLVPAAEVSPLEKRLLDRSEPNPPPALPLFSGVWTFPWYDTTLGSWFALTLGSLAMGIGMRGVISYAQDLGLVP
jgi:hypothetical protein